MLVAVVSRCQMMKAAGIWSRHLSSEGGDRRASIHHCGSAALIDFPGLDHLKLGPQQASDGRAPGPGSALAALPPASHAVVLASRRALNTLDRLIASLAAISAGRAPAR